MLDLALKLQVPALVAPAVDLTLLGLLVGTRHLALSGAGDDVLRPARRLLLAASVVTLLLNIADPVFAGQWGKAAFDSVGPLLLIGWAEAGPGLIRALTAASSDLQSVPRVGSSPADLVSGSLEQDVPDSRRPQFGKQEAPVVPGLPRSARNSWSAPGKRTLNTGAVTDAPSLRRPCGSSFGSEQ
ncbi:hypothetical protein [Amycolatopsis sp. MEPSY49]|uniref:hypothetical protein n=1 Tax=Amycolatopsis sp. MEPSY49 TaxID=3151600 RepID=UPI003EF36BE3